MRKIFNIVITLCLLVFVGTTASAKIMVYGVNEKEIENAIVVNGVTMVPVRALAEGLGMEIIWFENTKTVVLWNDDTEVRAKLGSVEAEVNGEVIPLSEAPVLSDGFTFLPLRNFAESINAEVIWNSETGNTDIYMKGKSLVRTGNSKSGSKVFYSQRDSAWGFENGGSGYCWVSSYAMILSEIMGVDITPDKVAEVSGGAYAHHSNIMNEFGGTFVKAIPDSSPYFEKYEAWRGATYINAENDAEVIAAIKEAIDNNPDGVLVRYSIYPHTMYVVGYEGDTIYFNEPAYIDSSDVTFENTCLNKYKISDLDFIQAVRKAE